MRKSASEIIRELETRIAKLEIRKVARDLITKNRHMEKALKSCKVLKSFDYEYKEIDSIDQYTQYYSGQILICIFKTKAINVKGEVSIIDNYVVMDYSYQAPTFAGVPLGFFNHSAKALQFAQDCARGMSVERTV